MSFGEFWRMVRGFDKRQEMEWARTYKLWCLHITGDKPSFDQFMGRAPVLSKEDKFADFWEALERDRAGKRKVTET